MKSSVPIVTLIIATAWTMLHSVAAFGATDIYAEIEAANDGLEAALAAGDGAAASMCYTEDALLLPPGAPAISGREGIAAFWQAATEGGIGSVTLTTLEVTQHDDTAIEIGSAEIFAPDGTSYGTSSYIVIWKNVDGRWYLHQDIWNEDQ